ncbi:MAG TPA: substrate-binding domain-containing protein, partial [Acidimicrobiales bacterium]|nr:substrate-binding domain-containing protein [Acidimicrobiales bacterium]
MNDESTVSSLNRRRFLQLLGATGASVALGACSNSGSGATSTSSGPSGSAPTGPVTIAFWNSMTEANLTTLKALVNQFHRSQSNITVSLVQQGSYTDTMTDYMA